MGGGCVEGNGIEYRWSGRRGCVDATGAQDFRFISRIGLCTPGDAYVVKGGGYTGRRVVKSLRRFR